MSEEFAHNMTRRRWYVPFPENEEADNYCNYCPDADKQPENWTCESHFARHCDYGNVFDTSQYHTSLASDVRPLFLSLN